MGQGRVCDPEGLGAYESLDMEDKDIPARKIQGPKNTRVSEVGDGERVSSLKLDRQAGTSQENIKVMFEPEKLLCEGLGGRATDMMARNRAWE